MSIVLTSKIESVKAELRGLQQSLKNIDDTMKSTNGILLELLAAFEAEKEEAKITQTPMRAEQIKLYKDDIKRCQNDIATMTKSGVEISKTKNSVLRTLEHLEKKLNEQSNKNA